MLQSGDLGGALEGSPCQGEILDGEAGGVEGGDLVGARAGTTSHNSGVRPIAAKAAAAAWPLTPVPTTAAVRAPGAPSVSAASTAAAPVRSAVTAPASSRASSLPSSASESSTRPVTVGRPRAGLPGNEVTHLSEAWPPPRAGIARKSPAG